METCLHLHQRMTLGTNCAFKEDRRKEVSTLHIEKKKKCLQVEQDKMWNLNNDYSIAKSRHSQLWNNNSLDQFVGSMIWCRR